MADKKVKVSVDLDFSADRMSIEKIKDQMDLAFRALKINLDPASYKKAESQLKELQRIANLSLNPNTSKINFKKMDNLIANSSEIGSLELLDQTLLKAGVNGTKSFKQIAEANQFLQKGLISSNSLLSKMGTTLANTIRWNISASAINAFTGELQRAYNFAKDLDRSLTDIRIVSGASASEMERFAIAANKSAQELKVSTIDYANASLVFFQQGLNAIEAQNMAEASIIGANITGESTEEMSNLLTSVTNGYKIATEDVLQVTDKLAAVGASTAADFYELATAMSKVASMANAAGVPIDELNAQIATIVSVTKESPESIGTSLKTIYGRMLAFKADTKALMTDEDGETFGAPNVEAALQAYNKATGAQISLFKTTKDGKQELRDLGEVINEIGGSWDRTTDRVAKFGLVTALAGSKQQNRLVSLFDAWDQYQETVETSLNAEGTSLKQNELYLESYEGKLKGLQGAKEGLYMTFTDSDGMKDFIEGLTKGVQLLTKLSEAAGGLNALLGIAGAALASYATPKFLANVDKFKDIIPKGSSQSGGQEELEIKKKLHAIEKAYGTEVANNYSLKLKASKAEIHSLKKSRDDTSELIDMTEELARLNQKGAALNFESVTKKSKLSKEQLAIIEKQIDRYKQLAVEEAKLAKLQTHQDPFMPDANPKLANEIDKTTQNVEELKMAIQGANDELEETHSNLIKMANISEGSGELLSKKVDEEAKRAAEINKITTVIRTSMMLLPSAINAATDDTKGFLDVLGAVGSMGLILIPNLASEIISTTIATGGLTTATKILGIVIKDAFLPFLKIGLIVAGIGLIVKAVDAAIVTFKEQKKIVDELSDSVNSLQSEYDSLSANTDRTADEEEYLALLKKELQIKKDLLKFKAEELEDKFFSPAGTTQGHDGSEASKIKAEIDEVNRLKDAREKLNATMSADGYKDNLDDIDQMRKLNKEISDLELSLIASQKELKEMGKDLGEPTSRMKSLSDEIDKTIYSSEELFERNKWAVAEEIAEKLAAGEKATDGWQRSLEALGFTSEEALAILAGNIENVKNGLDEELIVQEETALAAENKIKLMKELTDKYEAVTEKIQTYNTFLRELNSKEGLSAKSKQEIITKHQELLPYISDEQELRKQLIKIISDEEETQRQSYTNMIMHSEDFYNAKIKGNSELVKELSEYYGVDLSNYASLAGAKLAIESQLLSKLTTAWSRYYNAQTDSLTYDYVELQRLGKYDPSSKALANEIYNELVNVNKKRNTFDDMVFDFAEVDFKGINGGSKSDKDKPAYLDSLDAEIRAIKIKNDHLTTTGQLLKEQLEDAKNIEGIEGLNEQYRITGEIIANNNLLLESFKEEQDLIHKRANEIRSENAKYGNTDSWFDANAEQSVAYIELHRKATKAQQEEMDALFDKIQKLKKAWMESATEVNNIVDANKELVATQDDLIAKQKELKRVNAIKEHNEAYKKQQQALSYIADIQERIVEIIRKRGEAEKEALTKAHNEEMDSLQKRHNERKKQYAEDLSAFQKLIQDKLDAYREQNEEEDYAEALLKEKEKADQLNREINVLSLDDSLTARNKVIDLRKQLASQNEVIAKMQQDRERTLVEKSLQDQLKDFEESMEDKEEVADNWYDNEVKRLEENYKINLEYLEKQYSNEKVYSEARQAILDGEVEVSKGRFVELADAFEEFENEFGKGMGILGDIIEDEFNQKLSEAQQLIRETANLTKNLLKELDSDTQFDDDDDTPPTRPGRGDSGSNNTQDDAYKNHYLYKEFRAYSNMSTSELQEKFRWAEQSLKQTTDPKAMKWLLDVAEAANRFANLKRDLGFIVTATEFFKSYGRSVTKGYDLGGKITETGTIIAPFHGTQTNPEWIFNDVQLQDILKSTVKSAMNFDLPNLTSVMSGRGGGNQYSIIFDIEGNMDKSIMPDIQRMISSTIERAEFEKQKSLNKIGQFRPVK